MARSDAGRMMADTDERLADLKRMASARRGKPGFAANVAEIDAEIARLEAGRPLADERSHSTETPSG